MTHERESFHHQDTPTSPKQSALENYDSAADYDSSAGWQPKDEWAKFREQYRKNHSEEFCSDSMLETKPANDCLRTPAAKTTPTNLFGGLWRIGELAVLAGESGVGKSILAVQIAESIARGRSAPVTRHSSLVPQNVLYLDFQHTDGQFAERYMCLSPIPGKLPVKYRFSSRLSFTRFGEIDIPEAFNGDIARYFDHSLNLTLADENAKVIVIDNLAWLDPKATGNAAAIRRLRSLKLYAMTNEVSILVLHNSRARRLRPHSSLVTCPLSEDLAQIPDSIFSLCPSTFSPDIRYVKHLRSVGAQAASLHPAAADSVSSLSTVHHPLSTDEVLTFQLARSSGPVSSLVTRHSSLSEGPFLGFTFLGPSEEKDHLRDYAAEALAVQKAEERRIKRLRDPKNVVDMFLSPEYGRYLRGEK